MTSERTDYRTEAESDAKTMFAEFVDEMCEQWERDRQVSDDLYNDYSNGDEYHHSTHVDKDYDLSDLSEAAAVLEQLNPWEEADGGLWDGLPPRRAIAAQAAYTYGNAVYDLWRGIVKEVNDDLESLSETIKDNASNDPAADDDADLSEETEAAVTLAGQRYLRLYAELIDTDRADYDGMAGAAIDAAGDGDWTAALALADWLQEHNHDYKAAAIRAAVK